MKKYKKFEELEESLNHIGIHVEDIERQFNKKGLSDLDSPKMQEIALCILEDSEYVKARYDVISRSINEVCWVI